MGPLPANAKLATEIAQAAPAKMKHLKPYTGAHFSVCALRLSLTCARSPRAKTPARRAAYASTGRREDSSANGGRLRASGVAVSKQEGAGRVGLAFLFNFVRDAAQAAPRAASRGYSFPPDLVRRPRWALRNSSSRARTGCPERRLEYRHPPVHPGSPSRS